MAEGLTVEERVELVKAAIAKIEKLQKDSREKELDARAGTEAIYKARLAFHSAENEFAWQWANVKAIFEAKGI